MKTQKRIFAIGFAILCLAVMVPSADGQGAARTDRTHYFEFDKAPVSKVLDWLVEFTGIPLAGCNRIPSGSITFKPEVGPDGRPKRYTVPEIIDELNEILWNRPGQNWVIIRRDRTLGLYAADEPLPIECAKAVTLHDLYSRDLGKSEFVRVNYQLSTKNAEGIARTVYGFMGPFGQVTPVVERKQLILVDTVGNLRKLIHKIAEIEALHGG